MKHAITIKIIVVINLFFVLSLSANNINAYSLTAKVKLDLTNIKKIEQKTIKGKITDDEDMPLPWVNIYIKESNKGTVTDLDGNYSIKVSDENAVLVFSFVGFETLEITVGSQTTIAK